MLIFMKIHNLKNRLIISHTNHSLWRIALRNLELMWMSHKDAIDDIMNSLYSIYRPSKSNYNKQSYLVKWLKASYILWRDGKIITVMPTTFNTPFFKEKPAKWPIFNQVAYKGEIKTSKKDTKNIWIPTYRPFENVF